MGDAFSGEGTRDRPPLEWGQGAVRKVYVEDSGIFGQGLLALGLVGEAVVGDKRLVEQDEVGIGIGDEHGIGHAVYGGMEGRIARDQRFARLLLIF